MSSAYSTVPSVPRLPWMDTTSQYPRLMEKSTERSLEHSNKYGDGPVQPFGHRTSTHNTLKSACARVIPSDKRNKFILSGILRWMVGVSLSVLYYVAIVSHQEGTLSLSQKSRFDAIIVGISIALGLNIAASLREIAIYMRWWFIARRQIHIRELEAHSLVALLGLLWRSPGTTIKIVCGVWILLNIAIQVGISALSLTFKADPGIQDVYLDINSGMVSMPDMSQFAHVGRFQDSSHPQSLAAHMLGNVGGSLNFAALPPSPIIGQPVAKYPSAFWETPSHWEFIFSASAPTPELGPHFNFLSVYTNRSVLSSAVCTTPPFDYSGALNSTSEVVNITQTTPFGSKIVRFPKMVLGEESIYYVTEPILQSLDPTSTGICGPGCSTVHVFEPAAGPPAPDSTFVHQKQGFFFYECNITVTPPPPSTHPEYDLSFRYSAVAAQSIALSGQITPSLYLPNRTFSSAEYQSYTFGLDFGEAQNNSAAGMAKMLSRFAIGTVVAAAQTNPRVLVPGRQPRQGVRLVLEEPVVFAAILCVASGLQLGLLAIAAVLVRRLPENMFEEARAQEDVTLAKYLAMKRGPDGRL